MPRKLLTAEEILGSFADVKRALDGDSHLACAVLGGAYIEKLLGVLLRQSFIKSEKLLKQIFGSTGVLANCGGQNDIALALNLISQEAHGNIAAICDIRNDIAHSHVKVTFDSLDISNKCMERLSLFHCTAGERKIFIRQHKPKPRKMFTMSVALTAAYLRTMIRIRRHDASKGIVDRSIGKHVEQMESQFPASDES
jgi:hypothetical protein